MLAIKLLSNCQISADGRFVVVVGTLLGLVDVVERAARMSTILDG